MDQPQEWNSSMDQGFSLTEVLVSLLLMTTASLALSKHQWQTSQLFNQIYSRAKALSALDNAAEQFYVGYNRLVDERPFKWRYTVPTPARSLTSLSTSRINIQITWALERTMVRQLVGVLGDE